VQTNWTDILRPQWWDPMVKDGQWYWVILAPISLMFYGIYTRNFAWQARLLFGFIFGMVTGTVFQAFASQYAPQVSASFKPIIPSATTSPAVAVDNLLFLVIMVCVACYFFFAFEQNRAILKKGSLAGRWFLMIAFGAIFGSTIMTREALLIDRIYFILHDWLGIVK
jgi:L-cystine uptake protein TcyP (sodium:dicarboxylate symporter family)